LCEEVLADEERVLGPDHPDTVALRASLADLRERWLPAAVSIRNLTAKNESRHASALRRDGSA
jgi:hypothetical protein